MQVQQTCQTKGVKFGGQSSLRCNITNSNTLCLILNLYDINIKDMINYYIFQYRIIIHIKIMIFLYLQVCIRSLKGPLILIVLLMICKRFLPPINVAESRGLSGFFFFMETTKFIEYNYIFNNSGKTYTNSLLSKTNIQRLQSINKLKTQEQISLSLKFKALRSYLLL